MSATPFRLCVYCGSRPGRRPDYAQAAQVLGRALAAGGGELIYGGGRVGLRGRVAEHDGGCGTPGWGAVGRGSFGGLRNKLHRRRAAGQVTVLDVPLRGCLYDLCLGLHLRDTEL